MTDHITSEPKLSVVIVNYNVKYYLEQCLISLFASDFRAELEVIVVDNHSTDGSMEYFQGKFPAAHFIWNEQNLGFSKANNIAIKACKGEYVLLLNPDTVLGEHVLDNVVRFMDSHTDAGAVGVKMINGNGVFLAESKRGFPSPLTSFCKIFGLSKLFPKSRIFGKYHLLYLDQDQVHEVDILCGAFMMMRAAILEQIGWLDETFFMYGEDIDMSYRVILGGYKNYYLPEKIIHYKGESTKKDTLHYVEIFYHAMYIFFKKHYPRSGGFYSMLVPLGIFIRATMAGLKRFFIPIWRLVKKEKPVQEQLFELGNYTFEQVIEQVDKQKDKTIRSLIYSPQSGMVISSAHCSKKEIRHAAGK